MKNKYRILTFINRFDDYNIFKNKLLNNTNINIEFAFSEINLFEKILRKPYDLLIMSEKYAQIHGTLLYSLISIIYKNIHTAEKSSPSVIFICDIKNIDLLEDWKNDARVKDILIIPSDADNLYDEAAKNFNIT